VVRLIVVDLLGSGVGSEFHAPVAARPTPSTVCSDAQRTFGGPEVRGCCHGLVGRRSDIGGGVDQAAAGRFGERDDLVGGELMWSHPPHSLKPGLALFDGDLGFALGSHGDHPGRSS
jgi:hypothetical protein